MQAFVASRDSERSRANAAMHDREAQQWSDAHSRQKVTRFNKRWSAARKERYYQTFVVPWGKQRSQQQRSAYGLWMSDYDMDFDNEDDPYGLS